MPRFYIDKGMRTFILIWFGQVISMVGSGLTAFALGVRIFQNTGSVTQYAFIAFFMSLPAILISPLAGVLVDRWDRRRIMIFSNIGSALSVLTLACLFFTGRLQIGYIYLCVALGSICGAFLWPAFSASVALMIPKKYLVRANGMLQLGQAVSQILAPILAGALIAVIDITGLILVDFASFIFAVTTLLLVTVPRPAIGTEGAKTNNSLWREAGEGLTYLTTRPGLLRLLLLFAVINFVVSIVSVLITPLILSFSSPGTLGMILSVAGTGMLAGSLLISIWNGPRRRIHGILCFALIQGVLLFLAGLRPDIWLIAVVAFLFLFSFPIINGCSQAIWQSKVAPDIQGRVFAISGVIALSSLPCAYVLAGPLADYVFEPLLADGGLLAASIGRMIGIGPGRGIAFLFMILGVSIMLAVAVSYTNPRLRRVEKELPDMIKIETSDLRQTP